MGLKYHFLSYPHRFHSCSSQTAWRKPSEVTMVGVSVSLNWGPAHFLLFSISREQVWFFFFTVWQSHFIPYLLDSICLHLAIKIYLLFWPFGVAETQQVVWENMASSINTLMLWSPPWLSSNLLPISNCHYRFSLWSFSRTPELLIPSSSFLLSSWRPFDLKK